MCIRDSFFPEPNVARRAQLFEVWIRPVVPASGPMALKIALHELDGLIREGISEADFQATRDYLMKNVYLLTSTQGADLGTALDSRWYGTGDYVPYVRERLAKLTRADVNKAMRKHLSARKLSVVFITKDAEGNIRLHIDWLPDITIRAGGDVTATGAIGNTSSNACPACRFRASCRGGIAHGERPRSTGSSGLRSSRSC